MSTARHGGVDNIILISGGASNPMVMAGTVDPSVGLGISAPEGSLYLRFITGAGELHCKTGAAHTAWTLAQPGVAPPISFAQTNVTGIAQVIGSSVPAKITGASTFLDQGASFDNGGANDLTVRYTAAAVALIKFEWSVRVREDPAGAGADGTVNVFLAVGGVTIAASQTTTPVNSVHGGTASGVFIRSSIQNEVFELFASRDTGAGDGAIQSVVLTATIL